MVLPIKRLSTYFFCLFIAPPLKKKIKKEQFKHVILTEGGKPVKMANSKKKKNQSEIWWWYGIHLTITIYIYYKKSDVRQKDPLSPSQY